MTRPIVDTQRALEALRVLKIALMGQRLGHPPAHELIGDPEQGRALVRDAERRLKEMAPNAKSRITLLDAVATLRTFYGMNTPGGTP